MSTFDLTSAINRRQLVVGGLSVGGALAFNPERAHAQEVWKVAWVQTGPVGDAGWTYQQDLARRQVEKELNWVKTLQVESVSPSDTQRVMEDLIGQGAKVLMVQDPGVMDLVLETAKKHLDKYFIVANAFKWAPNVGGFFAHLEQATYLSGLVAGSLTKSNLIGFVGAFPVPPVIQAIDGFALGVKEVNPTARIRLVWIQDWYNPPKERQAAQSLLDVGADVVGQYVDSPTVCQTAEAAGKWAVGANSDMSRFAPRAYLTGYAWQWSGLFVKILHELRNGTWKPETKWGDLADGTVQLGPLNKSIPANVVALVEKRKEAIIQGQLNPFTGPIKDNTGKEQVPAGKALSESELRGLRWFVDNVDRT